MICPFCCSPRHFLCAAGFRISVNLKTYDPGQPGDDRKQSLTELPKRHLLGPENKPQEAAPTIETANVDCIAGSTPVGSATTESTASSSITTVSTLAEAETYLLAHSLVVLPVFSDCGAGEFGQALLAARAPQLFHDGKLNCQSEFGQSTLVVTSDSGKPEHILLIGLGSRANCSRSALCGLVGSAIDKAVFGGYNHLVVALADFSGASIDGRQLGAVARCRLSVAVVEEHIDRKLEELTLVVRTDQVEAICSGIEVPGLLCSSCSHPLAGTHS